jgi:anaerobic selenocysteine-containing dehydrogenase
MLHVIIAEDLIDTDFVRDWCYGYEELKSHVQKYPPAWGEQITGVPAEQIVEVARLYANTKAAAIDLGNGVEHTPSSSDAIRAVAILMAVTGHWSPRLQCIRPVRCRYADTEIGQSDEAIHESNGR